ncbi:MAG: 50S ribosomal protein L25 [Candidatus Omnitrophica bacterium]|nr:50S ribosomal protein L25 [Candidatus Omnitrophota bacterium]
MEEIQLAVQFRKETRQKLLRLVRGNDLVPAVVYGGKEGPMNVKVNRREFEKIMRAHRGQSVIFHLNVLEGEKKLQDCTAIVKDEQLHPVHETLLHLDFKRISLKEEIEVKVPLVCVGEPVGIKKTGGSLDQPMHELSIICLPTNIPKKIEVNVAHLEIGDAIHVSDLVLPANVRTKQDPTSMVASAVPPMKDTDAIAAEESISEPEITREKKEEPKAKEE